jgi:phosphoglycolate phosphatase-like HAD superfamily hydrolase
MEAIERHTGKAGSEEDLIKVESRLMFHLKQRYKECREDFIEVPGANLMLDKLQEMDHIAISLATGCWADEARFKLDHSGFNLSSVPMASSNDAIAREEILKASLHKAKESNGVKEFKSVTYIGDGIWDLNSALKLGYNFIGIGERLRPLKGNGLRHVHEDYNDINAFMKSLDEIHRGTT